jgi:hypothetical protein
MEAARSGGGRGEPGLLAMLGLNNDENEWASPA